MGSHFTKAQKIKLVGSLTPVVLLGIIVILVVGIYLHSSLGWFSANREVFGNGMSASVDGDPFPDMKAWRFNLTAQSSNDEMGDTLDKSGTWVNAIDMDSTTSPRGLLPVETNVYTDNAHGEKYKFKSLHLGTIDNLLTLSNDNCFYIRFDVTDEVFQPMIAFSVTSADIRVYDSLGNELTADLSSNKLEDFAEIIRVDAAVCVSTTGYEPADNQAAIDALFSNETKLTNGATLSGFGETLTNNYFLYVRISPNLEKCFEATDHIATAMPCEVTFDVTITVSFD